MSPANNDPIGSALGGLLGGLLGGHPDVQSHMDQTGKSLDEVLGTLSGGPAASSKQQPSSGTDVLGSLLGSVLGGGGPSGGVSSPSSGGDVLGSILGGVLGGGSSAGGRQPSNPTGDVLGSILSGALGGATSGQAGGISKSKKSSQQMPASGGDPISSILGGLLGTNMGGGLGSVGNNPIQNAFLQPIVNAVAQKTGLSPQIAQIVVVFALTTLMSAATQKPGQKGFSAGDLVTQLSSNGTVPQSYLKDSGLVSQLAQQSGLDQATASQALQQTLTALGTHMGGGTMADKQAALKTVLKKKK